MPPNTDPNTELATQIVDLLNSLLVLDHDAIHDLIEHRAVCNDALADHPTVQVVAEDDKTSVGMLGILNGLCGYDLLGGVIVAKFADRECKQLIEFYVREPITLLA